MIWAQEENIADERCCNLATHAASNQRSLHPSMLDLTTNSSIIINTFVRALVFVLRPCSMATPTYPAVEGLRGTPLFVVYECSK